MRQIKATTCTLSTEFNILIFGLFFYVVAFRIYDMDNDGFISNGELFQVLKMMVGNNLKETQLQQIVDKTVINADKDGDGKISFSEFCAVSLVFTDFIYQRSLHKSFNCHSCLNSISFTEPNF